MSNLKTNTKTPPRIIERNIAERSSPIKTYANNQNFNRVKSPPIFTSCILKHISSIRKLKEYLVQTLKGLENLFMETHGIDPFKPSKEYLNLIDQDLGDFIAEISYFISKNLKEKILEKLSEIAFDTDFYNQGHNLIKFMEEDYSINELIKRHKKNVFRGVGAVGREMKKVEYHQRDLNIQIVNYSDKKNRETLKKNHKFEDDEEEETGRIFSKNRINDFEEHSTKKKKIPSFVNPSFKIEENTRIKNQDDFNFENLGVEHLDYLDMMKYYENSECGSDNKEEFEKFKRDLQEKIKEKYQEMEKKSNSHSNSKRI